MKRCYRRCRECHRASRVRLNESPHRNDRHPLHFPLHLLLDDFEELLQTIEKIGERGRNRTFNLLIKSQLLCQLSYAPAVDCGVMAVCQIIIVPADPQACLPALQKRVIEFYGEEVYPNPIRSGRSENCWNLLTAFSSRSSPTYLSTPRFG